MSQCGYFHVECACGSFICRGFFPEEQKKITLDQAKICRSPEHISECLRYKEAKAWQDEREYRKLHSEQCRFLERKCAACRDYVCKGRVPPFTITDYRNNVSNNVEACMTAEHKGCPFYREGLEHLDEWRRVKGH